MSELMPLGYVRFVGINKDGSPVPMHPDMLRWYEQGMGPRVGGTSAPTILELDADLTAVQTEISNLATQFLNSSPGAFNARLFADIGALRWADIGLALPSSIRTAGYSSVGKGAATYYRLTPGSYVANAYTIQDAEGNWWQLPPYFVQPEQVGAPANGVDSDQAAFDATISNGYFRSVVLSATNYVGVIKPGHGKSVISWAGLGYTGENPTDIANDLPRIKQPGGAQAVIDLGWLREGGVYVAPRGVVLSGLLLDGVDGTCFGVSAGSNRLRAYDVQVITCSMGWGGATVGADGITGSGYTHSLRATRCTAHTCNVGMQQFVDSEFTDCEIANCTLYGFHGIAGANANTWTGGRIEFTQSGDNININGCTLYTFANFISDRGFETALTLIDSDNITFNGVIFNRAGAGNTGVLGTSCAVFMQGCKKISFTGCDFHAQHDDGGVGVTTPMWVFVFNQINEDITITGGSFGYLYDGVTNSPLDGYTVAPIKYNSGLDTTQMPRHKISGVGGINDYDNWSILLKASGRQFYAGSGSSAVLLPTQSKVFSFTAPSVTTFDADAVTLRLFTRDETHPTTGVLAHAKYDLLLHQEGAGSMLITPTTVYSEIAATAGAIAFGAGSISLALGTPSTNADGSIAFDLTATNAHATDHLRIWARLMP